MTKPKKLPKISTMMTHWIDIVVPLLAAVSVLFMLWLYGKKMKEPKKSVLNNRGYTTNHALWEGRLVVAMVLNRHRRDLLAERRPSGADRPCLQGAA